MAQQCMHSFMHPPAHAYDLDIFLYSRFAERNSSNDCRLNWVRHGPQSLQGLTCQLFCFDGYFAGAKRWWCDRRKGCFDHGIDHFSSGCRVGDRASDGWRKPYQGAVDLDPTLNVSMLEGWQIWQCAWWQVEQVKLSEIDPWLQMVMIYHDVVSLWIYLYISHKKRLWECSRPLPTTLFIFGHFCLGWA